MKFIKTAEKSFEFLLIYLNFPTQNG